MNDLTKTRITKLIYLIDWESIKEYDKQLTSIRWYFDHYGPYVSDVLDTADKDESIKIEKSISNFGTIKYIIKATNNRKELKYDDLTEQDVLIIDRVINKTKRLSWNQFINYVYNTEPIKFSVKYNYLDLSFYKHNF